MSKSPHVHFCVPCAVSTEGVSVSRRLGDSMDGSGPVQSGGGPWDNSVPARDMNPGEDGETSKGGRDGGKGKREGREREREVGRERWREGKEGGK